MSIYKNVMELLVEEEVVQQFKSLPPQIATYINQVEWVAHALNQLPPLYATSEKGLDCQLKRGKSKHGIEIRQAVQRALVAIRRDPLRTSTPLRSAQSPFPEVLSQLRFLLRNDQVQWNTLAVAVEQALEQASQGKLIRKAPPLRSPSMYAPVRGSSPFPQYQAVENSPITTQATESQDDWFGWDDPLYHSL